MASILDGDDGQPSALPPHRYRRIHSAKDRGPGGGKTVPHVQLNGVEHKSCSRCGRLRPLDWFKSDPRASDRLRSACAECEVGR
jgi:hypothetical protein